VKDESGNLQPSLNDRFNLLYKSNVFSQHELEKRVPKKVIRKLQEAILESKPVDDSTADVVAQAMKEWALERGCTHYSHWFQPMRGPTAEKHDSFIDFFGPNRDLRYEFTGEALQRGEPDASSFPGGGLRSTYEARGYTAWDPSSPPFVLEAKNGNTLLIPTMYISWTGEALDNKTPLLRSVHALSTQAVKLLHLLGDTDVKHVSTTLGPEQEFFVIDRAYYNARPDLYMTGRSLLGAKPPKGQEKSDHYFGPIPERVLAYIQDVEEELWKLGIPTKTRHNEVAPAQHEMAPIFEDSNVANDHNLLVMHKLEEVAPRHGLVCLLHEKPFAGVNGSGKHNNWSMATDTGINLLNPTDKPLLNPRFLVFLTACIKAVDVHADLLRASIGLAGNDHRLGANEAPPAIMSVYLGDELNKVVERLIQDAQRRQAEPEKESPREKPELKFANSVLDMGVGLRPLKRDRTDRNRTSPFAFTGNKFEFRAPGSSQHCSRTVSTLNLIVADALSTIHDDIVALLAKKKEAQGSSITTRELVAEAVKEVIGTTLVAHARVVFNGNGYSEDWVLEAESRGLPNHRETVSALEAFSNEKNIALFAKHHMLSKPEVIARGNVLYEDWIDTTLIESRTLAELASTHVVPAALKHQTQVANAVASLKAALGDSSSASPQVEHLKEVTNLINTLLADNASLKVAIEKGTVHGHGKSNFDTPHAHAVYLRDNVLPLARKVRHSCDHLEELVDDSFWPLPKYREILHLK